MAADEEGQVSVEGIGNALAAAGLPPDQVKRVQNVQLTHSYQCTAIYVLG